MIDSHYRRPTRYTYSAHAVVSNAFVISPHMQWAFYMLSYHSGRTVEYADGGGTQNVLAEAMCLGQRTAKQQSRQIELRDCRNIVGLATFWNIYARNVKLASGRWGGPDESIRVMVHARRTAMRARYRRNASVEIHLGQSYN